VSLALFCPHDLAYNICMSSMAARPDPVLREAIASLQRGKLDDAERQFRAVLRAQPRNPVALDLLGAICAQQRRWGEAEEYLTAAIAAGAKLDTTFYNYGVVLKELGRPHDAIAQLDRALAINPRSAEAYFDKAMCLLALERYDAVQPLVEKALAINPKLVEAWVWLGHLLSDLGRHDDAFSAYDRALAISPEAADAWLGRARLLRGQRRYNEALAAFNKALSINPRLTAAWLGRGRMFLEGRQYEAAAASFSGAVMVEPAAQFAKGYLQHIRMIMCDWKDVDASLDEIERDIEIGKPSVDPASLVSLATSPRSFQLCAQIYSRTLFPAAEHSRPGVRQSAGKIRVGYVSSEFRDHAATHLLVGVLEHHDRTRFEIHAFDNGSDDRSEARRRLVHAVDAIADISRLNTRGAVDLIRSHDIDVLVNLNGYFNLARMDVFARRASPVQVNYLGFPGTLGADYMDYIVADRRVIPEGERAFYSEKVVYLPGCYQPNDDLRKISDRPMTRAEFGLPDGAFVFCGFHKSLKILPRVFDAWMRILKSVDGSVLWLLDDPAARENLRREATARGVDAERIVFAKHAPLAEHLARHRLADLFLDTLPCNAHTSASDALWAGLPVLTQVGSTFPGRVAASLLASMDLPQLVTETPEQYLQAAIDLARDRVRLAAVRDELAAKRLTAPLFNTATYTRGLERAFQMMAERDRAGLPPDHIELS
jgi:predicted O-linked N-acetylglucosamine transferase (SPINDLY family)